ncbi:hypothetical protein [Kitasatospora sp. NPDC051914]|uniref:hypothetical protein n=1 Tax=Kitasatospora sp. NPDC051914 TaxID=3154945 RepID=UPI003444263F
MGTFWAAWALAGLVTAALLLLWPLRGRTDGLTTAHLAALRGGSRAALVVAVVEYRLAGPLDADRGGRLRLQGSAKPPGTPTPLHRAVRSALARPLALADVAALPVVLRARRGLRRELVARHLLCGRLRRTAAYVVALGAAGAAAAAILHGSAVLGAPVVAACLALFAAGPRTAAGRRELARRRRLHPLPPAPRTAARPVDRPGPADEAALLVALHGRRALRVLLPVFAARTGMLGGRTARDVVSRSDRVVGYSEYWALGSGSTGPGSDSTGPGI